MRDTDRISRVQDALREQELDALLVSLPRHVLMLTGYYPVVGTSAAVFTREGAIALIAPKDEEQFARESWADPLQYFEPASLEKIFPIADVLAPVLAGLRDPLGLAHARIAIESGPASEPSSYSEMHLYAAELWHIANQAFPSATFVRAHDLLAQLESVKTPQEIAAIRTACSVAAAGFDYSRRDLHLGSKEMELVVQAAAIFATSAVSAGVDRQHAFIYCMSGPNSAKAYYAYAHSTARRINQSDAVLLHCNSQLNGFWTDITRTYLMGNASPKLNDMTRVVLQARDAALQKITPGVAACEVDRAAREVIDKNGYAGAFKHPTGHGVGFGAISGAALPRLHPKSTDKLETGMVFNVEPAIYLENIGGIRQCEMVAVTSTGYELLTPFQSRAEDLLLPKRRVA